MPEPMINSPALSKKYLGFQITDVGSGICLSSRLALTRSAPAVITVTVITAEDTVMWSQAVNL